MVLEPSNLNTLYTYGLFTRKRNLLKIYYQSHFQIRNHISKKVTDGTGTTPISSEIGNNFEKTV